MPAKQRLILVYGGPSAEHDVSRVSALHVSRAADPDRFDVELIGVTHDGAWTNATALADRSGAALTSPDELDAERSPAPLFAAIAAAPATVVVFPLIHGPMGEDGTLQGLLEIARVPYVGAGVLASAVCMEKPVTKAVLRDAGIPQSRFRVVRAGELQPDLLRTLGADLGYPVFVKPSGQGSSVGVAKVDSDGALGQAITTALRYGESVVVEEYIQGRELEVAVLGNDRPECTPAGEIVPSQDFYDYEDKYVLGAAELRIPAPLDPDVMDEARRLAVSAYRTLQVEGFARVDLFLRGARELLVNEVNTIPGFTPISMYPKLWDHAGVGYRNLISRLVDLGIERFERRRSYRVERD